MYNENQQRSQPMQTLTGAWCGSSQALDAGETQGRFRQAVKKQLWGGAFWSPSYFLASTGQVTLDVLKRYVENQNAKDL